MTSPDYATRAPERVRQLEAGLSVLIRLILTDRRFPPRFRADWAADVLTDHYTRHERVYQQADRC